MTRKFKRLFLRKQTITQDEYDKTINDAEAAKELLEDERFSFLRDHLTNTKASITQTILENRITEVKEVLKISDKLKRIFTTPKIVQVDELVGQYKLISQVRGDLEATARMKKDLEEAVKSKAVIIETDDENV